jgi:glycosyltransferase involved in cell wall biosynthesis
MNRSTLSILLVGDYPDDPQLGSSKVFYKLREEFAALGHTCDVLWSDAIGRRPAARQLRQLAAPWMAGKAIVHQLDRRKYDVVDVASAEGLFLGVFGLIGRRNRPAFVCRSNGLEHLNYARMLDDHRNGLRRKSWVRRIWYPASRLSQVAASARLADALIVLTEVDRAFALDRGWQPPDGVSVVPHGVSARFLAATPAPDAPRGAGLLFCGTWDHMKGISYLCAAINRLHATGHPVKLTVLGPGMPRETVLDGFDAAVRPYVTVIDRVPEDRVMDEYRRHDALLFTSTYEGFGMIVVEAMSQRLPVIATPSGCAATLVRDGETGYRVPPRDAEALAAAVLAVTGNAGEARRRAGNARAEVSGMTWQSTAEQTLAVYRGAMERIRR